jgi:hypothetical protein
MTCAPTQVAAAQDWLYLNLGDGRFQDVTESSGIIRPNGKGQGIVAADFDGSGRLSLFVSNDTTQNFYFVNQTAEKGGPILFEDQALLAGLAVNGEGVTQASMGIAAGDGDGDGRLDLFVTNFIEDYNTFYQLQPNGLFGDQTRQTNLRDSGFNLLGFGTQFLDGDLDGDLDLVIANGHVEQTRSTGNPDRMPAQYLPNLGQGQFGEDQSADRGPYFREKHYGRGIARLDWNRDGLEDFLVSHLDTPAALLTNTTPGPGNFVSLKLVGTNGDRDAIGTIAILKGDGRTLTRQLTAGDGYQTSNEKALTFGLGDFAGDVSLTIQWTSGTEQTFPKVPINQFLLAVEGEPLKQLPRENARR